MRNIAGFFGLFNYNKPGKGVRKDEPKKGPIALYFTILLRKFFKLVQLNLLYLIFIIPFLLIMIFVFSPFITRTNITDRNYSLYLSYVVLFLIYIGIAPVNTGLAYIFRSYAREQHAWVLHDFFEQIKVNFKTSIKIFVIDVVVLAIVFINFSIYGYLEVDSIFYLISKVILIAGCIIYIMMHFYIYQIIITYEVNLWTAFKSSLIFALGKLPMNLLILVIVYLGAMIVSFPLLILFIGITPFIFAINLYAERVLSKNIKVDSDEENIDLVDDM